MDKTRVSEVFKKPRHKFIRILKELFVEFLENRWGR